MKWIKTILKYLLTVVVGAIFLNVIAFDENFQNFVQQFIVSIYSFIREDLDGPLSDDMSMKEKIEYVHRGPNGYMKGIEIVN